MILSEPEFKGAPLLYSQNLPVILEELLYDCKGYIDLIMVVLNGAGAAILVFIVRFCDSFMIWHQIINLFDWVH
jgi:hypothetical protein